MAISITGYAKTVSFSYDKELVKGTRAFISARNPNTSEVFEEKKSIKNDGSGALSFPQFYAGLCDVEVVGSSKSEGDSGQLHIV